MGDLINFNDYQLRSEGYTGIPEGYNGLNLGTGTGIPEISYLNLTYDENNNIVLDFADDDTGSIPLSNPPASSTGKTKLYLNENENMSQIGSFQNKYIKTHRAEDVNAELFDGPVVTLSQYDQERIIKSGIIDDIEGYTTSPGADCFSRVNADGVREFIRIVNDNGNYKVIHTVHGEDVNNTEVLSLNRKDVSNFIMPENFQGAYKNSVKYDNLGNYHILATSGMNTIEDIIKSVYGVSPNSEEGKKIYDAIKSKNALLNINSAQSIIGAGEDIVLVDKKELDAIEKANSKSDVFNANVNIQSQYVKNDDTIPYLLLGPENPDPNVEYPVIVYLHGDGQKGRGEASMYHANSPGGFMQDLDLDNFNGYIICPQLDGKYYMEGWNYPAAEKYVRDLIDNFSKTHNIDSDRIALTGASRGGMGTLYLADKMGDVFCSAAALSGYYAGVEPKNINIPIRGYVGKTEYGEDGASVRYMKNTFAAQVGEENLTILDASHGSVPKVAFGEDLDNDNRSDLIQWLFQDTGTKDKVTPSYFKQSEPRYPKDLISLDRTPVSLTGDIRYVNWEEYGYSRETGAKFAASAENVETRLKSKGITTKSNCLGGVKDIFIDVTGESPFGLPSQGITVASQCASVMENLEGYREITGVSVYDLRYLPAGAVIVWSSSATGDNPADKYGHISVSLGDGREASSTVVNQYMSVGKSGKPRVFIPII